MIWLACELGRSASPISPAAIATAMQRPSRHDEGSGVFEVTARRVTAVTLAPIVAALVVGCLALYLSFARG
jgi:hypothetical protein